MVNQKKTLDFFSMGSPCEGEKEMEEKMNQHSFYERNKEPTVLERCSLCQDA